jgi:hypothetical protein
VIFAAVARWRRQFLLAVLVVAVALSVAAQTGADWFAFPVATLLAVVLVLASVVATTGYRPAALVIRADGPALAEPPGVGLTLVTAGQTLLGVGLIGEEVADAVRGEEDAGFGLFAALFWLLIIGFLWYVGSGSFGVRLTPDGLVDRQAFSRLRVPWEAFADQPIAEVGRTQIRLRYREPALVRVRGLRPFGRAVIPATVDTTVLAGAIHEYATRPDRRPTIGA